MRTETLPATGTIHTEHLFGTSWHSDSYSHWHECAVCGEKNDVAYHIDDGGIITVLPTATTSGIRTYSFYICGHIMGTETIPALTAPTDNSYPTPDRLPAPVYPSDYNFVFASKQIELTVSSELTDLSPGRAHIESFRRFFSESAVIRLTETSDADHAAELAMNSLDSENMICYPFDISVYSASTGEKIMINRGGYINFEIPVPNSMKNVSDSIAVYHIQGGKPEYIESEIVTDINGNKKIKFTAKKFSPYMFTAAASEDIASEAQAAAEPISAAHCGGMTVPAMKLPRIAKWLGKKKKYRVIRKQRSDDLVFVF